MCVCVCVNISVFLGEYLETEIHMSILGDWILYLYVSMMKSRPL